MTVTMRFSGLSLLSQRERRALRLSFRKPVTILRAGNGMGKSAVIKSLYDTFGASPPRIDQSWTQAGVTSAVEFDVNGKGYTAVKSFGTYSVFDAEGKVLIRTSKVLDELSPFFAELLDFKLVMADRNDKVVIPPPAYIFAPFYIDQDRGWTDAWSSFDKFYLPGSKKILAEYHSGLKPNEYYVARAERERLKAEYADILRERSTLDKTYAKFREAMGEIALNYDLDDFQAEVSELIAESEHLHSDQSSYRRDMGFLSEEKSEWMEHQRILKRALQDMRSSFSVSAAAEETIDCPTCGATYHNGIIDRFGLIENEDDILKALIEADEHIKRIDADVKKLATKNDGIAIRIAEIQRILRVRKEGITFRDVVSAESRSEANRVFRERLESLEGDANAKQQLIMDQTRAMEEATNKRRAKEIRRRFAQTLDAFADRLDVRAAEILGRPNLTGSVAGRGSERPRALLAFYYSFLDTAAEFSSSALCPIVLDAPNQQGQDDEHMPAIMSFLAHNRPAQSQLIVAAEKMFGLADGPGIEVIDIGNSKNQILRPDMYEGVFDHLRPILGNLL